MKRLLPVLLSLVAMFNMTLAWSAEPAKSTQPLAVLIAADWCFNCKVIKPKLKEAYKGFEGKVRFATLDVTDDKTFIKAKQEAYELGVPKLLIGSFATGWVALYDRNGKQVGRLMQDMSVEDMRAALKALVDAKS